jgi:hypothetical protein
LIEEVEKNLWTILEQKEVLEIQKGVIDEIINELTNHGEMVSGWGKTRQGANVFLGRRGSVVPHAC